MAKIIKRPRRKGEVVSRKETIRNFCVECMGYEMSEVRECTSPDCWLYPWRLGSLDEESINQEKEQAKAEKTPKKEEVSNGEEEPIE